ncbi:MAG TPA: endonuclease/exonuclease/phosphatase family protein [Gammaproteobacteria bacterium]|nr:endonuclease/exonuclease/phosphatase family protein [Gammaproteobacteria bacterium]
MKLITLNIWGGHVRDPLHQFIETNNEIDIFCFQEVYHKAKKMITIEDRSVSLNIFSELQTLLPDHTGYFKAAVDGVYGIGMFIKKGIALLNEGDFVIHENPAYLGYGPSHSRILQWAKCNIEGNSYMIMNVHGLWNGMGKTDTPERIAQSEKIKEFMDNVPDRKILCGDFNLKPDTRSLKIIADGMHDLIDKYNILSTRTSYYPKEEKFADYVFTSPDIKINKFSVLRDEVSDHAPLLVDFD